MTAVTTLRERIKAVAAEANGDVHAQANELKAVAQSARRRAVQIVPSVPMPDALTHPDELTDHWLANVIAAEDDTARVERQRAVLSQLANRCESQAFDLVRYAPRDPSVLPRYADLLDEIMAAAGQLAPELDGVNNAHDAFKYDTTEAWSRAVELADDYKLLRTLQDRAHTVDRIIPTSDRVDDDVDDRRIRNLDKLWPDWWHFDRHPTRGKLANVLSGTPPRLEPWPADPTARLLWFARHPQWELWVPTDDDVTAVRDERRRQPAGKKIVAAETPRKSTYIDASNPSIRHNPAAIDVTPTISASEYAALMGQNA